MLFPEYPPASSTGPCVVRSVKSVDGGNELFCAVTVPGKFETGRLWNERIDAFAPVWAGEHWGRGFGPGRNAHFRMKPPIVLPHGKSRRSVRLVVRAFVKSAEHDPHRYMNDPKYKLDVDWRNRWVELLAHEGLRRHWIAVWALHPSIDFTPANPQALRSAVEDWRQTEWVGLDIETQLILSAVS